MTKEELEKENTNLKSKLQISMDQNEKLVDRIKEGDNNMNNTNINENLQKELYTKINKLREIIRKIEFIKDKELPNNLGGGEYYSIGQYYNAIQDNCVKVGLDFSFDTVEILSFDKELIKPSGKMPIHVATVKCVAKLTDINTGLNKGYITIGQCGDSMDKAVSGATTMAFRGWFDKNFSPRFNDVDPDNVEVEQDSPAMKQTAPKVPVYIPEEKKEEIKKEVVKETKTTDSDDEDIQEICDTIMKIRELTKDDSYANNTMQLLLDAIANKQQINSKDILQIKLKVNQKLKKVIE